MAAHGFRAMTVASNEDNLTSANLTSRQKTCLSLWAYDGLGFAAIAREIGVTEGTVRGHIRRANDRLATVGLEAHQAHRRFRPRMTHLDQEAWDNLGGDAVVQSW